MRTNSFILLIILALAQFFYALNPCSEKTIFSSNTDYTLKVKDSDISKAFNEEASCVSLEPDETGGYYCCYVKVKFEYNDEKYTQKGCLELSSANLQSTSNLDDLDFEDDIVDPIENKINQNNEGVEVKSISIKCSSKFLHITGIIFLLFFL